MHAYLNKLHCDNSLNEKAVTFELLDMKKLAYIFNIKVFLSKMLYLHDFLLLFKSEHCML